MKSKLMISTMLLGCAVAVSGCESDAYKKIVGRHAPFGTENLIDRKSFQKIDLAAVLTGGEMQLFETDGSENKNIENRRQLELAFKQFHKTTEDPKKGDVNKRLRNQVQERILAASNQACAEFKRELKALDARVNFILGALTTATGVAGGIFTGGTSQALSATAGILSGVRAEFNEDYFQMLTIQVITDGFGKKRQEIYKDILANREEGLTEYPVQRAIKDAILYHDNCSLVAGLEQAALSLERAQDPGLKRFGEFKKEFDSILGKEEVDKPILPLTAFSKAQDALNALKVVNDKLTPRIEELKKIKEKIRDKKPLRAIENDRKNLISDMSAVETKAAKLNTLITTTITTTQGTLGNNRKKVESLQGEWPDKFAAFQVAAAGTVREKAKGDLIIQREKARAEKVTYDGLRNKLRTAAANVSAQLKTIDELEERAKRMLALPNKPYVDLNGLNKEGIDLDKNVTFNAVPDIRNREAVGLVSSDVIIVAIKDSDSAKLDSVTVTITNVKDKGMEFLGATATATIKVSFDEKTKGADGKTEGALRLTGPDTPDNYKKVLLTVGYINKAAKPDKKTPRIIEFVVEEAGAKGTRATTIVTIK
ncbi:MAG: hypothetical protein IIA00_00410 [Proteobacteria bacterium]|nr:hypothetical protein [Pseudomonadota bacterium]